MPTKNLTFARSDYDGASKLPNYTFRVQSAPGGLSVRTSIVCKVLGHEVRGQQNLPRDDGHDLGPEVRRELLVKVGLREVNLLGEPDVLGGGQKGLKVWCQRHRGIQKMCDYRDS